MKSRNLEPLFYWFIIIYYVCNASGNFEKILNGNGIFHKITLGNGIRTPPSGPSFKTSLVQMQCVKSVSDKIPILPILFIKTDVSGSSENDI